MSTPPPLPVCSIFLLYKQVYYACRPFITAQLLFHALLCVRCAKCARSQGSRTTSYSCSASFATGRTTRTASPPPRTSLQRECGFAGSASRAPPAASLRFGVLNCRGGEGRRGDAKQYAAKRPIKYGKVPEHKYIHPDNTRRTNERQVYHPACKYEYRPSICRTHS